MGMWLHFELENEDKDAKSKATVLRKITDATVIQIRGALETKVVDGTVMVGIVQVLLCVNSNMKQCVLIILKVVKMPYMGNVVRDASLILGIWLDKSDMIRTNAIKCLVLTEISFRKSFVFCSSYSHSCIFSIHRYFI